MRLQIHHVTRYTYTNPVRFNQHRLVLRPREGHDLRVERMTLSLEPAGHVVWARDVFGNSVALVDWLDPASSLTISNDIVVERVPPFPAQTLHKPWQVPLPPHYDPLEASLASIYLQPTYLDDVPAIQSWLGAADALDAHDAEGAMITLCKRVHATVAYRRRGEKGVQTPAHTLERRTGSCRDLATLLMEAARSLGVAARFASGYLHGRASMAAAASTHAWTEIYLPALGWRGLDPTLGGITGLNHIVTGVSTHPRGVMPVSGTFTGTASDYKSLSVSVKTTELGADEPSG